MIQLLSMPPMAPFLIYVALVGGIYLALFFLSREPTSPPKITFSPKVTEPMAQATIQKIKCHTCKSKFKAGKDDIHSIMSNCNLAGCDLKSDKYKDLIRMFKKEEIETLEFPDPIVIHVDENGNTNTVP